MSCTGIRCHGWEGPCDSMNAERHKQNTRYQEDELNWKTLCPDCWNRNTVHWDEMWKEYHYDTTWGNGAVVLVATGVERTGLYLQGCL